ncbi:hypothetical protein Hanom_Chr07g00666551 [Helianthus anomalus]
MASEGGHTNDATARRRRIAEKGSDRLALITAGRTSNPPTSSNASLTGMFLVIRLYIDLFSVLS